MANALVSVTAARWHCDAVHTILQSVWSVHCWQLKILPAMDTKPVPTSFQHVDNEF